MSYGQKNELDMPSTKTRKLNYLKLTQTPCLTTVSNENEELWYSKPLGSFRLSNEHENAIWVMMKRKQGQIMFCLQKLCQFGNYT